MKLARVLPKEHGLPQQEDSHDPTAPEEGIEEVSLLLHDLDQVDTGRPELSADATSPISHEAQRMAEEGQLSHSSGLHLLLRGGTGHA